MKTMRYIPILLALVLAVLTGCERRPLVDASEFIQIRVDVNIKTVANVTCDVYNEHIPVPDLTTDMMRVLVYDPYTKQLLTQSFISNKSVSADGDQVLSGTLNISYGNYDIVVYNFDTPTTQVTGESNEEKLLAYTTEVSAAQRARYMGLTKADPFELNYEPDHLVVAREHDFRISPHDSVVVIQTEARTIIDSYYIQIHVEGMQFATAATAVISGLSPSNYFGLDERNQNPIAAVAFDMNKSTDPNIPGANKDVLCAVFNTFGKIPDVSSDLYVTFNVIDVAGNLQTYTTSLDRVFLTEDAIERHWLLIDETWVIDDPTPDRPPQTGGGFQPTVDDWEEEHGEIAI